jgi:glycosyltransferase involved in cell wall biosynthesis
VPSPADERVARGVRRDRSQALRVAVLADMLEEGWPSMDLVADALMRELPGQTAHPVEPCLIRPALVRLVDRVRLRNGTHPSTADRVFNRFFVYPRRLERLSRGCEVFHIVDHSYSHLALSLPPGRVVTTCHDLDTFRGFDTPGGVDTGLPRFLVNRLVRGLRASALVVCPSRTTADDIVAADLASRDRVVVVPNGVDGQADDPRADAEAARLLAAESPTIDLLHVGSTIDRKRIDLLLDAVAHAVPWMPDVRLLRVGGAFTAAQEAQVARLGLTSRIRVLPFLERKTLQSIYRRATVLLVTSDREGFGLPVVEALAAGVPVIARDLPVFREVAGGAATFVDSTDPSQWSAVIRGLVEEARANPAAWAARREVGRARARSFSWHQYGEQMAALYARASAGAAR